MSQLSAAEEYELPTPDQLDALLSADHQRQWSIDTRESTPLLSAPGERVEDLKVEANRTRQQLTEIYGEAYVASVRKGIAYPHYWRTEAYHLYDRASRAEKIRQSILDTHYWKLEALVYRDAMPSRENIYPTSRSNTHRKARPAQPRQKATNTISSSETRHRGRAKQAKLSKVSYTTNATISKFSAARRSGPKPVVQPSSTAQRRSIRLIEKQNRIDHG
jgi:hypothetical protein